MNTTAQLAQPFAAISDIIAAHGRERGDRRAVADGRECFTYAMLDGLMNRIARSLQREGVAPGTPVALLSATTARAVAVFMGIVRAGCVPAPIAPSSTPDQVAAMIADARAPIVFLDAQEHATPTHVSAVAVELDALEQWLEPAGALPDPAAPLPEDMFNIIYSSGTTGMPKGVVHTHAMRWRQIQAYAAAGFADSVTMVSTPLYSNTTLVSLLPTLAYGGTAVILGKFDALAFLECAERERATHAMLVPAQYQRIMAEPDFDRFDLSSFRVKTCTSAPFSPQLKAEVLRRWPGMLVEIYGMTEGGGMCVLYANMHPTKLHTVGVPAPGHDIRIISEDGLELPPGEIGEVVGRSGIMMAGYHGRDEATRSAMWQDATGQAFIRHGDLGRFDEDGFLTLSGRTKDVIISGGFNIYPCDIEAALMQHPAISDAAVIGKASARWGETPYAFYVTSGVDVTATEIVDWVNARLGKTQRLSGAEPIDELPRNVIGKVLKRELREYLDTDKDETGI